MRVTAARPVQPGQPFEVDVFRSEDAEGVSNLFCSVYGQAYPVETYYWPDRISEQHARGLMHSVVARTRSGDIVSFGALYRSSAPFAGVWEVGQFISLESYRATTAMGRVVRRLCERADALSGASAIFGESVCNHLKTQKLTDRSGYCATALEIELMPHEAYVVEDSAPGRVSCLVVFRVYADRPQHIFVPGVYREALAFLSSGLSLERTVASGDAPVPPSARTHISCEAYPSAGVFRALVETGGSDFGQRMDDLEREAAAQGIEVFQCMLRLDCPWVGATAETLRRRGYFLGGYLPRWFDADGLLMQRVAHPPDFALLQLHDERSLAILDLVRRDREQVPS